MATVPESPLTTESAAPNFFQRHKMWLIGIGLFLVSNLSVYFYQRYQINKLEDACIAAQQKDVQTAEAMTLLRSEEMANNLCRTLVFGIRGEMERSNKATIDLFLQKMVQESGLDLVIIQDAQDSIYLSTDKKYENHKVPYIQGVISAQQVLKSDLDEVVVAAPILGSEIRLGTMLLVYKAPSAVDVLMKQMKADSIPGSVPPAAK